MCSFDGAAENLREAGESEEEFQRIRCKFIEYCKGCASCTHLYQHADRMVTYHTIKIPDTVLKSLTQERFDGVYDKTSQQLKAMEQYLTGNLFAEFSEALALLFYVILPGQSRHQIQSVWYKMGWSSLVKCMEQCTRKPTDEEMDKIRAACAQDGPLLPAYIQHGQITDECLFKALPWKGPSGDCDLKGMKSQRFVQLTNPDVQAQTLAHLAAKQDKKVQASERKVVTAARKATKAKNLVVGKGAYQGRRQTVSLAVKNNLRSLSQSARCEAGDTKCLSCPVLFSVLRSKPEHKTAMWFCEKCECYQCSLCANERDFGEKHVKSCGSEDKDQEQDIQEAEAQGG